MPGAANEETAEIRIGGQRTPSKAGPGVGGAGFGTGLVAIAQSIGPSTPVGAVLLYAAPAASVLIGSGLYFIELQLGRYLQGRLARGAIRTLTKQLENQQTSSEHKKRLRKQLEEVEAVVATSEVERVRQIGKLPPRPGRSSGRT